jgi:hypothetical protein
MLELEMTVFARPPNQLVNPVSTKQALVQNNVATNVVPTELRDYFWLSWPLLAIGVTATIILTIHQMSPSTTREKLTVRIDEESTFYYVPSDERNREDNKIGYYCIVLCSAVVQSPSRNVIHRVDISSRPRRRSDRSLQLYRNQRRALFRAGRRVAS